MDDVFQFAATFKDFPPRSFPPSFVPTNIMEGVLDDIKEERENTKGEIEIKNITSARPHQALQWYIFCAAPSYKR